MPYVDGDGRIHRVLPSADQLAIPTFTAPAVVEIAGAVVAGALALAGQLRLAAFVLAAAMVPYAVALLARRDRVLRGLHGGDEGVGTAGALALLVGAGVAVALAAAGYIAASAIVLGGALMLGGTAQSLLAAGLPRPWSFGPGARVSFIVLAIASVGFALGVCGLVGAGLVTAALVTVALAMLVAGLARVARR